MARIPSHSETPPQNPGLEKFLYRLPPDVAASFTERQLQAIQQALPSTQWKRHPVDIRVTLPLLWKKYYFVMVAGPERRSPERLVQERKAQPLWKPTHIALILALSSVGILSIFGVFQLQTILRQALSQPTQVYPAGIPFKEDRASCEDSGRIWQDGNCYDYEHDPTF